jgi:hypothetical protein
VAETSIFPQEPAEDARAVDRRQAGSQGSRKTPSCRSALPLLMAGIRADDVDNATTANHLAVLADPLHAGLDFHDDA